jgi:hypothetical protein
MQRFLNNYKNTAEREQWPVIPISNEIRFILKDIFGGNEASVLKERKDDNCKGKAKLKTFVGVRMITILSFFGPFLFGFKHLPYLWFVPAWAVLTGLDFSWNHRKDMKEARDQYTREGDFWHKLWMMKATLFLVWAILCAFIAMHSIAYFIASLL